MGAAPITGISEKIKVMTKIIMNCLNPQKYATPATVPVHTINPKMPKPSSTKTRFRRVDARKYAIVTGTTVTDDATAATAKYNKRILAAFESSTAKLNEFTAIATRPAATVVAKKISPIRSE